MRSNSWLGVVALLVAVTAGTGCCRGSSSSGSSSSNTGTGTGAGIGSPGGISAFKAGDSVDVQWNGSWWQARILSVNGGLYRVHYAGYGSNWDESVTAARVRPFSGTAKRGTGPGLADHPRGTSSRDGSSGSGCSTQSPAVPSS